MDEQEIWKDIPGYEGLYMVSNMGRIKSLSKKWISGFGRVCSKTDSIMAPIIDRKGYQYVTLRFNGGYKKRKIHRLVAEIFIPNPKNKETVNHINGVKTDNRVVNLEWATVAENNQHACVTGLWDNSCRKIIDIKTGKVYRSMKEASEDNNLNYSSVRDMLSGHRVNKTSLRYLESL